MNKPSRHIPILCLVTALTGCGVVGTVTDLNNSETEVRSMHLSGPGTVRVHCAGVVKDIPLESFQVLTLFADDTRTIDGELCFLADITLKDGTRMIARDKAHENRPQTYVSVNATLRGKSHHGDFSVELAGVSRITVR